eukprot:gnl/MRDRNA2_/MRDRNA2_28275_c0_seq1.p1 gnl/MRDRNA2_/MRDRNA2_28275_c0~~gnl/MRDRNA2_/MRDRNA2_28275_c0_seq1.p1  ORF type:complete len:839 (-),score=173.87 gnl/MRDRNA2_/MRDRNA2_28275_c0_seq1:205-2721(-)
MNVRRQQSGVGTNRKSTGTSALDRVRGDASGGLASRISGVRKNRGDNDDILKVRSFGSLRRQSAEEQSRSKTVRFQREAGSRKSSEDETASELVSGSPSFASAASSHVSRGVSSRVPMIKVISVLGGVSMSVRNSFKKMKDKGSQSMKKMKDRVFAKEEVDDSDDDDDEDEDEEFVDHLQSQRSGSVMLRSWQAQTMARMTARFSTSLDDEDIRKLIKSTGSDVMSLHELETTQPSAFRLFVTQVVCRPAFDAFFGCVVLANTVELVIESEISWRQRGGEAARIYDIMDAVFLSLFTVELMLRLIAAGCSKLRVLTSLWLDFVIVITGWIHLMMVAAQVESSELRVVQALKVLRVIRAVRVLRMMSLFHHLWLVVQSFFMCIKPLAWTFLFILIMIFLFAMFVVELVDGVDNPSNDPDLETSKNRFRSCIPALWALFQIMTLDEWFALVAPFLENAGEWAYPFFIVYIPITGLAMMNLITAMVVDIATRGIESELDYQFEIAEKEVERKAKEVREIFDYMDADGNGALDLDEWLSTAREPLMLQDLWDAFDVRSDADLASLFGVIKAPEAEDLSIFDVLSMVMKLQAAASDKMFVAIVRDAKTAEAKANLLSHGALGNESMDLRVLHGSMNTRLEGAHQHLCEITVHLEELSQFLIQNKREAGKSPLASNSDLELQSSALIVIQEDSVSDCGGESPESPRTNCSSQARSGQASPRIPSIKQRQSLERLSLTLQELEVGVQNKELPLDGHQNGSAKSDEAFDTDVLAQFSVEDLEVLVEALNPSAPPVSDETRDPAAFERLTLGLLARLRGDPKRLRRVVLAAARALGSLREKEASGHT